MNIQNLKEVTFDFNSYSAYLDTWLKGIESEAVFWMAEIETKCSDWMGRNEWYELISDERKFLLDSYLDAAKTAFIDVGSGPFSSCGLKTDKSILDFHAVNPLAFIYQALKKKANITTGITPSFGMFERLSEKYKKNTFDIVYMRNALDHSFNPVFGILQLLYICKTGGKVILHHGKNEAANEKYQGFHQWNLCAENNEFVIWRQGDKYNISKILDGPGDKYADVIIEKTTEDLVHIVMVKKKEIEIDAVLQSQLISILDEKVFHFLSNYLASDISRLAKINGAKIKLLLRKIPVAGIVLRKIYHLFHKA